MDFDLLLIHTLIIITRSPAEPYILLCCIVVFLRCGESDRRNSCPQHGKKNNAGQQIAGGDGDHVVRRLCCFPLPKKTHLIIRSHPI